MAVKRGAVQAPEPAEVKTKPVRVDLPPAVHKALRKEAAEKETSMAALARTIISEKLGFKNAG
jgi:predicted HicB family RNase H-like nuclease